MIATACVGRRGRTSRSGWIVRVVDVLVITVDNRGKAIVLDPEFKFAATPIEILKAL